MERNEHLEKLTQRMRNGEELSFWQTCAVIDYLGDQKKYDHLLEQQKQAQKKNRRWYRRLFDFLYQKLRRQQATTAQQ